MLFFNRWFVVLLFSFTVIISAVDISPRVSRYWSYDRQNCRSSVRHIEGGGIGYKQGYTTLEAFFAPNPEKFSLMPFFYLRGHVFNDEQFAANIGFGLRTIKSDTVYGFNLYYDYRNAKKKNYNQLGFGIEALSKYWDFRAQGYFPAGKKAVRLGRPKFSRFLGNSMLLSQKYQVPMTGADAEVGFRLGKCRSFDFYAAVGPYYFSEKIEPNVWGGKARVACTYKEYVKIELSNSYDKKFHNKFQCQLTLTLPFGNGSTDAQEASNAYALSRDRYCRMVQPVERKEIIVLARKNKCIPATDPLTNQPYRFVFVDNTSHSLGTYESPYPTLALAQENSQVGDILYVFPGDGTTNGMDSGIILKRNQKLWGSGVSQALQTGQGAFIIPALSSAAPKITNTNIDTEGNAIILDSANQVRGITITGAIADGIFGVNLESLDVSRCTFTENNVFPVDASFVEQATMNFVNNTVDRNINGLNLVFDGPSTLLVSNNTFSGTTSVSSAPLIISAGTGSLAAVIENNSIKGNTCGGIHCVLNNTNLAQIKIKNNMIADNATGSVGPFGAAVFINASTSTLGNCALEIMNNTVSGNSGSALYCANGSFNDFTVNATNNTLLNNGGSGFAFTNSANSFKLNATNNSIVHGSDNGISTTSPMTTADIIISHNTITGNTNSATGIALTHDGTDLNLVLTDNDISQNQTSGISMYPSVGIQNVTVNIAHNTINGNQNVGSNAASGIDLEQFNTLSGAITNNTFSGNTGSPVFIGSTAPAPSVCLELRGNVNDADYTLSNGGAGTFNLAPCNVSSVNTGVINTVGVITPVQSCPTALPCPP